MYAIVEIPGAEGQENPSPQSLEQDGDAHQKMSTSVTPKSKTNAIDYVESQTASESSKALSEIHLFPYQVLI